METKLVDDERARKILGDALDRYDGSGDYWMGVDGTLDVNVYVEDGQMWVVLLPYTPDDPDGEPVWQTLAHVNKQEK